MPFAAAHARCTDWREGLEQVARALAGSAGDGGPGFVYLTEALAPNAAEIVAALRATTGISDWIGAVGVGVIGNDTEYRDEGAIAVLVADWPRTEYRVFSGKSRAPRSDERTPFGAEAAYFAVVHGDPQTPDMPALIEDMAGKLSSGRMVGGLASANGSAIHIANDVLRGGLSGVVLSSAIPFATRLTQGCAALPGRYKVTAGERNIIATIDGRPALEVYREAIGPALAANLRLAAHTVLVGLPTGDDRTDDYLARNIVGIDPRAGMIAIGAEVEPGMSIRFCRRDASSARLDLERMLDELVRELDRPARAALYFSCLARGAHMFGADSVEIGLIRERLGAIPIVGFFANGEISRDRLYAYTGVLTVFA